MPTSQAQDCYVLEESQQSYHMSEQQAEMLEIQFVFRHLLRHQLRCRQQNLQHLWLKQQVEMRQRLFL